MLAYGLFFAVMGYAFSRILLEDVFLFYTQWLHNLPVWLGKPMGLCAVCLTGQLSLWGMMPLSGTTFTEIITHLGIVCLNMVIVKFLIYAEKD